MREEDLRKGPWYEEEDERLKAFVAVLGARRWDSVARISGLRRSGKSCRLRWLNYLRPFLKHGPITPEEEHVIVKLHERWGNKWAKIARRLPGRTDNEIKNYWRTHLRKNVQMKNLLPHHSTSSKSPSNNIWTVESSSSSYQTNTHSIQSDASLKEGDTITPEISSNTNNITSCTDETIGAISGHSRSYNNDDHQKGLISDCMITNSPYEDRLSDWMNLLLKDEETDKCSSPELCLDYPISWCLGDDSAWDFLDTKWDIDLFNM